MELSSSSSDRESSEENQSRSEDDDDEMETHNQDISKVRQDLGDVPFEELDKMREKIGIKRYQEFLHAMEDKASPAMKFDINKKKNTKSIDAKKRKSKNSPMELSSKIRVPKLRKVVPTKQKITRDPRFDDLSGHLNEELFEKSYSFIDGMRKEEKKEIMNQLKNERDSERKEQLSKLVQRLSQQEEIVKKKRETKERESKWRKEEMRLVEQGKKPYYMKKSDKKKLELMAKFETLKKSGKLEKYMGKKRKRNAAKERRKLPGRS